MSSLYSKIRFEAMPIVGILRGFSLKETLTLASISEQTGLKNIEITMNTAGAEEQIKACLDSYGEDLNIGAGTVCDCAALDMALEAGAQFIVTPNVNEEVIRICVEGQIPIFAGAFTPTEIHLAYRAGATMVKIFPAEVLGPAYIKAVLGPFDQIPLMPTGGVSPENMQAWKDAGAKAFGVGGKLYNTKLVKEGDWAAITALARQFVAAARSLSD